MRQGPARQPGLLHQSPSGVVTWLPACGDGEMAPLSTRAWPSCTLKVVLDETHVGGWGSG